ncbi:hypothetical protein [Nonomuraea sp. NPDC048826]|uniref:hypothetical protein n=1 Tax=Nonomuraea sp. NPDC048826 TaxID=3364347 RepID=UPI0037191C8F
MGVRMLGLAAALALALTGCGASSAESPDVASAGGEATATASAGPSLSGEERGLKWAQCMRENGVDMADPEPGGRVRMTMKPGTQDQMKKAEEACKQWQPSGGMRPRQEGNDELRKLAACMRENGVEKFPDPDGGRVRITQEVGEDPDFKEAEKKCQMGRPSPGSD